MISYTATTENDSDVVAAATESPSAALAITLNGAELENGGEAQWQEGSNALELTVTLGETEKVYTVTVTKTTPSADLSSLTIGSLTLTPTFDAGITAYAAATTNATNKITAVAEDEDATITILNGETPVDNEGSATWADGENTLTVKVTRGDLTKTYTVTVTRTSEVGE